MTKAAPTALGGNTSRFSVYARPPVTMCGRYAFFLTSSQARRLLEEENLPVEEAPDDDDPQLRQTYNFAPGYHGLIYRAQTSHRGSESRQSSEQDHDEHHEHDDHGNDDEEPSPKKAQLLHPDTHASRPKYILQSAKWGLIPFWTKRPPDYASQLRTINCRDDSLAQNGGMWNTMKQRKRCVVIAQGFYEWLKKGPGGKDKVPHFVKRRDGGLMLFAGLWDCVRYETEGKDKGKEKGVSGKERERAEEGLYTYTIITTDSNKQLSFLHDRMPVILEPGSEEMKMWLDPEHVGWDKELQGMLKPFRGELDIYPVDQAVGKVGNNSPSFVVPVDSKENKKNIANFFGKQREKAEKLEQAKVESMALEGDGEHDQATSKVVDPESNAPLPKPEGQADADMDCAAKGENVDADGSISLKAETRPSKSGTKREMSEMDDASSLAAAERTPKKPSMSLAKNSTSKMRSATSNMPKAKTPTKQGNARITAFFGK